MNKKFLSLVLALVMVLGTFGSVFAAEKPAEEKKDTKVEETKKVPEKKDNNAKVQWLVDNEIVLGRKMNKDDKNNDLALDKNIQRAEITKLLVYAIGRQDLATKIHGQVKPYSDVKNDHWANGFITVGTTMASPKNALPFLHGYVDGSFKPENDVTYVELAKMLVVLVKEDLTQADFKSAVWPRDWMAWAAQLGILDGVKVEDSAKAAVREDAFVMLYNALYKLGELRNLPAHETMGIISAASANKLTLNQGDFKKDFTVNASTNFVPGEYTKADRATNTKIVWGDVVKGNEEYYIGSLVRVLADDKGNVTHIVQLGNPTKLGLKSVGWTAVAKEVQNFAAVTLGDLSKLGDINTIAKTRYFVADYADRQLTEVKDKDAALALFDRTTKVAKKVYVGYDVLPNSGIKEAKVVVFGDVDVSAFNKELVRVVTPGSNEYSLTAQKSGQTATAEKSYDLRDYKAAFPLNYNLEKYDVINLYSDLSEMVINHSEDPIYKITKIEVENIQGIDKVNGRKLVLTLKDEYNTEQKVDVVADADFWFYDEVKVNANVQVRWSDKTTDKLAVDVVSVVPDTELRGLLPGGTEINREEGILRVVQTPQKGGEFYQFNIVKTNEAGKEVVVATYVTREAVTDFDGSEVTFLWDASKAEVHGLKLAYKVELSDNQKALDGITLTSLDVKDKVKDALAAAADAKADPKVADKNKAVVEKAVKEAAEKATGFKVKSVEFPNIKDGTVIASEDGSVTANITFEKGEATNTVETVNVVLK